MPVALASWAAAGFAIVIPDAAAPAAVALWAAAVAALGLAARSRWPTALALVAVSLAFSAAAVTHVAVVAPTRAEVSALQLGGGRVVVWEADVVGKIESGSRGYRFDAIARTATIGAEEHRVSAPILVRSNERPDGLDLGSRVRMSATAFPADAGDREVVVVDARTVEVIEPAAGALAVAASLRAGLVSAVEGLPQPGAGLVPGLAVGDTSAVSPELDAQMKAASLSHLTAVSGANCALVVGIAFGLAALCGARRGIRVVVALSTLVAFVVLVSPEPSVVRAATMAAIAMLGVLLGRIGAGVSLLCASVGILLVIDPWLAGSLGFALSAVATGALLLLAGPLADGLSRWVPGPLALAISVPLAAQLACGPLIVLIEPTVPLVGVLANMLAAPAAPVATVVGLLACLALPVPVLAQGLSAIAWLPAAWIAGTAEVGSALPGASAPWLSGLPGLGALAAVGAVIAVTVMTRRPRVRRIGAAAMLTVAVIVAGAGPVQALIERGRVPDDWTIAACEVGQGDAVLVRDAGRVMLIDTGPDPALVAECLDLFAVDRVDVLVLTHFDLDHRGGAEALVGKVGLFVHGPAASPEDHALVARFAVAGAQTQQVAAGQSGFLGECRWNALWPRARDVVYPSGNDASVVVEVTGCRVPDALFLGDLSAQAQRSLVATGAAARSYAVVKVAHHGSADQDAAFYETLRPRLALVTVGENTYGHPRAEILDLLREGGAAIARTDRSGAVAVVGGEGVWGLWRSRGDVGGAG